VIRRRLADEQGVALVAAMMVVLLIALFTAVMAQSALDVNETSTRDRDAKRALAAAETGMNTALARVRKLAGTLPDHKCLSDSPLEVEGALASYVRLGGEVTINSGQCAPSSDERGGNGEYFRYHVSPVLSSSANGCNDPLAIAAGADRASLIASGLVVLERCITAVGTVNGVQRRVQRRAYSTLQLFSGVTVDGQFDAEGADGAGVALGGTRIQSNGPVTIKKATFAGEIVRHRGVAEPALTNVTGAYTSTTRDRPFPLGMLDLEPKEGIGPTLKEDLRFGVCAGPALDLLCASHPFVVADKSLRVGNGYTLTLSGGEYYLCELTVASGGTLQVTADTTIWLDSPSRTGNNCVGTGGTGKATLEGAVNPAGTLTAAAAAARLRLYVWGGDGETAVTVRGGTTTIVNALVYAPQSFVAISRADSAVGAPTFTGAISARRASVTGAGTTVTGVSSLAIPADPTTVPPLYEPGEWVECQPKPAGGLPHSKCRGT
jgi:hypothetical protein